VSEIRSITTLEDIRRCFPVMVQLRPHLDEETFIEQVQRQCAEQAYRVAAVLDRGTVTAVAGYRIGECLAWGKFMYVDDLVTDEASRGMGHGGMLFDWLAKEATRNGCAALHLDSGVQRFDAHRFYLTKRMAITSHHFGLTLLP
jgi:GNAT superfamily N-acetyltransferase